MYGIAAFGTTEYGAVHRTTRTIVAFSAVSVTVTPLGLGKISSLGAVGITVTPLGLGDVTYSTDLSMHLQIQ